MLRRCFARLTRPLGFCSSRSGLRRSSTRTNLLELDVRLGAVGDPEHATPGLFANRPNPVDELVIRNAKLHREPAVRRALLRTDLEIRRSDDAHRRSATVRNIDTPATFDDGPDQVR